jgi:hypothetical protein
VKAVFSDFSLLIGVSYGIKKMIVLKINKNKISNRKQT